MCKCGPAARGDSEPTFPWHRNKWLKKVHAKWAAFLEKMRKDWKTVPILERPYNEVFQTASSIYKTDGQSLNKWLTESLHNSADNQEYEAKEEVSISTYKEQFKNMLSLDIWIDKLLQWQHNGYKLEMPVKEQVDPLQWNPILKSKLLQIMKEEDREMHIPAPKMETSHQESSLYQNGDSRGMDIARKRMYSNYSSLDTTKDSDKYRQLKIKKLHEAYGDSKNESVISTDKASEISLAIRQQVQRPLIRPQVSMSNIFKSLTNLKNEVKMSVYDESSKNVVHLDQLDSDKIGVSQCLSFIEEYNTRAPKIILNWMRNVQKQTNTFQYAPIKPEVYNSQIPLKPKGERRVLPMEE